MKKEGMLPSLKIFAKMVSVGSKIHTLFLSGNSLLVYLKLAHLSLIKRLFTQKINNEYVKKAKKKDTRITQNPGRPSWQLLNFECIRCGEVCC